MRKFTIRGMLMACAVIIFLGGMVVFLTARAALRAEWRHQDNILVFKLVTAYIEQNDGAWPNSWDDLRKISVPNSEWPDNINQVRKNVTVDFSVQICELENLPVDEFRAIRPTDPGYTPSYVVLRLQDTIRECLAKQKDAKSGIPSQKPHDGEIPK